MGGVIMGRVRFLSSLYTYKVIIQPLGYFVETDISAPGLYLPTLVIFSSLSGDIGGYFHLLHYLVRGTGASVPQWPIPIKKQEAEIINTKQKTRTFVFPVHFDYF